MKKGVWVELKILPKSEILDVQGRAIVQTLKQNEKPVQECRYGKCIQILMDLENSKINHDQVRNKAMEVAKYVLFNPLIENCEVKVMLP